MKRHPSAPIVFRPHRTQPKSAWQLILLIFLAFVVVTYIRYESHRPLNRGLQPIRHHLGTRFDREISLRIAASKQFKFANYADLTDYLVEPFADPLVRLLIIYRWETEHIRYDVDAFRLNSVTSAANSPEAVFRHRLAVCQGYSELLRAMGMRAGLAIETVSGTAKPLSAFPAPLRAANHAWNIVKIDGFWFPLDATWDAGYVDAGLTTFTRRRGPFKYFLPAAEVFAKDHAALKSNRDLIDDTPLIGFDAAWALALDQGSISDFLTGTFYSQPRNRERPSQRR